jgi:hypothetical protein
MRRQLSDTERLRFLERVNESFAKLRADSGEWALVVEERVKTESTLSEDLLGGEVWTDDGECISR